MFDSNGFHEAGKKEKKHSSFFEYVKRWTNNKNKSDFKVIPYGNRTQVDLLEV